MGDALRIPQFEVVNVRALRRAACEAVPPVMVITGPNGCGKSTLLNELRRQGEGDGRTLYVGPHRTSRRQEVRMEQLSQQRIEMMRLLESPNLPSLNGINISSNDRNAWNPDETQSYLKHSICQIELDRTAIIAKRFDDTGSVSKTEMPDIWHPLREMTQNLLPHLQFVRVDMSNRQQVRCLWRSHNAESLVDLDDLSSGEKAVVQLFFPLIEHQIDEKLHVFSEGYAPPPFRRTAVLMDEPEIHLHPNIQQRILDYMRKIAASEAIQFIVATHSPSMAEQSTSEELYLLRPSDLVEQNENQLVRIAGDEERLRKLREVFGTTSNVTSMRRTIVVEGADADSESRRASDSLIYGYLDSRFSQINIISGGGKSEALNLVRRLNELLRTISPSLTATGLLDRDLVKGDLPNEGVVLLPVSMIENFLLDPMVIWSAIDTVRHKTTFTCESDVATALDKILDQQEAKEVSRRVKSLIPPMTFRLKDPIEEATSQATNFASEVAQKLSATRIETLIAESRTDLENLKERHRRREHYDGKEVLSQFFKKHLHLTGMSREIFVYGCAKVARSRKSVEAFLDSLFSKLSIPTP